MDGKGIIDKLDALYKKEIGNKYSKSKNKKVDKTIKEHIRDLYDNYKILKAQFSGILSSEEFDLLKLALYLHDFGKLNALFQQKLVGHVDDLIPHNYLSPLFLYDIKDDLNEDELLILFYSLLNHHARGYEHYFNNGYKAGNSLRQMITDNFVNFQLPIKDRDAFINYYIDNYKAAAKRYKREKLHSAIIGNESETQNIILAVKISGLLIRLDHASSGDIEVEEEPIAENREKLFQEYLEKNKKSSGLRDFQREFKDCGNLAVVADTGMGKTGLSFLWSKRKMFYVLPNRTSTNAMFETYKDLVGDARLGLLHSTSVFYLMNRNENDKNVYDENITDYQITRALSKNITITTADQLFTSVFKYPCYEKIYATLSYSDIVIDEIQGFSPQQIVPILWAIEETVKLGARYLIITATLPKIIQDRLKKIGFQVETSHSATFDNTLRHKIRIEEMGIFEYRDEIIQTAGNVLVIVNNVKTAIELYKELADEITRLNISRDIQLLHSRFIWRDRMDKEKRIKNASNSIWITTQLVEASLDIDFDILFTESAPADSLIQRMGRVWRHRKENYTGAPNIRIAMLVNEKRVDYIYEKSLRDKSLELIESKLNEDGYLVSKEKRAIVEELYSEENLKGTKYMKEWDEIETILNTNWALLFDKISHNFFRDVLTIEVIPDNYKNEAIRLSDRLNELASIEDKGERQKKRFEILKDIKDITVGVPLYFLKVGGSGNFTVINKDYNILLLSENFKYSEETGVETGEDEEDKAVNKNNIL